MTNGIFTKFKPQFTAAQLSKIIATPAGVFTLPVEMLTPAKTVGRGKNTYINLKSESKNALDFEVGATPYPYARFEGAGWVAMHFDPSEYGITSAHDYVMEFNVQSGDKGATTSFKFDANTGVTTKWDRYTVDSDGGWGQLVMKNVPNHVVWGRIAYDGGDAWVWYSTSIQRV